MTDTTSNVTLEYWNGSTWAPLSARKEVVNGQVSITWTPPDDWKQCTITQWDGEEATGYFIKVKSKFCEQWFGYAAFDKSIKVENG